MRKERTSSAPAIELRNVGVQYYIASETILSFKEYVLRRLSNPVEVRELWAVKSIDLTVQPGEIFGIVGRNGAGKSTLLKVISRVLRPTTGRVIVRGRVAPLLSLGAGFHPDLTGVENIYLNASLLGYPRALFEGAIPEIVEFAELEGFIEAPIRTYSAGMIARLGFSVATQFRPDILIVDEVLAVGDVGFQEKCFERLRGFRRAGTTILLVSHSTATVAEYCDTAALIDGGEIQQIGETADILETYDKLIHLSE